MTLKIEASRDRCKGHGQCELFAPSYFEIDEEALVLVLKPDVDPDDADDVREAVAHCPELALKLIES